MNRHRFRVGVLGLLLIALATHLSAASFPAPRGEHGAVTTAEADATAAGLEILRHGGNAVDAAVASALALAVVHPQAGNLGGGGFAVTRMDGEILTLDFRETAPASASRDMYLDEEGKPIADASVVGPLAAGVPGSPSGLHSLHARLGHLPWKEVVEPAHRLAAEGFLVTRRLNTRLAAKRETLLRFPETAAVWLRDGEAPETGTRTRLPLLAETLTAYAEKGPAALVRGEVAERIVTVSRKYGGILTARDLASYQPVWRDPVTFEAFGWKFASMSLPSSGGIILGQTLGLLERVGWQHLESGGARRLHLVAEAWRQAFADRLDLADPSSARRLPAELLADDRLDQLAEVIAAPSARSSLELGPELLLEESLDTTHISVIDKAGNSVALTTTLNGSFGSSLWVPGFGFLNNEMDDFSTAPGQPNLYGLVQGEANSIEPGRRMLSSMTPGIAWSGDQLLVFGGQGGSRIPTAVSWVVAGLVADRLELQEALDRPRIHHQWLPDRIDYESGALSPETRASLVAIGHRVEMEEDTAKVAFARRLADGRFEAAGDPRGPDVAGVVRPEP